MPAGQNAGGRSATRGAQAAAQYGAAEYRQGNPGVVMATRGSFDLERSIERTTGGFRAAREIGVNRFTGSRDIAQAREIAARAYQSIAGELGARRAAGQTGLPTLAQVRRRIAVSFGVDRF